jgi:hypothetical protein
MSASAAQKVVVVVAFILVGVPTGLCSIVSTPLIIAGFLEVLKGGGWEAFVLNLNLVILWLVGLAIAYLLIRQLRSTFGNKPGGSNGGNGGAPP